MLKSEELRRLSTNKEKNIPSLGKEPDLAIYSAKSGDKPR